MVFVANSLLSSKNTEALIYFPYELIRNIIVIHGTFQRKHKIYTNLYAVHSTPGVKKIL